MFYTFSYYYYSYYRCCCCSYRHHYRHCYYCYNVALVKNDSLSLFVLMSRCQRKYYAFCAIIHKSCTVIFPHTLGFYLSLFLFLYCIL